MAKHVLYGDITSTAKQPYLRQTHQHYNDMIDELTKAYGETIVADSAAVTILWGCENTGTGTGIGQSAVISAGAVYYNGEIYQVPAFSTASIVNGLKGTITTTYAGIDPILFSDSTTHNVHQIKTMVISDATSGFQYSTWKSIKRAWKTMQITDSDIQLNVAGTFTVANATQKQLNYNIDYKNLSVTINIFLVGLDVSPNSVGAFRIRLPENMKFNDDYLTIGRFFNTYDVTTEASGHVKETTTIMYTGSTANDNFLTIAPSRASFVNFDTTGNNNISILGQIVLPYLT